MMRDLSGVFLEPWAAEDTFYANGLPGEKMTEMREHEIEIGGMPVTVQLTEAHARAYGLITSDEQTSAESTTTPKPRAPRKPRRKAKASTPDAAADPGASEV